MREAMRTLSPFPRLAVSGLLWGVICGVGTATLLVSLFVIGGVAESGFEGTDIITLPVGIVMYAAMASTYGAVIGGVLGVATGMVAGLLLTVLLELIRPRVAALTTVVVVLVIQATIGLAVPDFVGIWWILPTFAVIPMTLIALDTADVFAQTARQRRDTFAA